MMYMRDAMESSAAIVIRKRTGARHTLITATTPAIHCEESIAVQNAMPATTVIFTRKRRARTASHVTAMMMNTAAATASSADPVIRRKTGKSQNLTTQEKRIFHYAASMMKSVALHATGAMPITKNLTPAATVVMQLTMFTRTRKDNSASNVMTSRTGEGKYVSTMTWQVFR